MKTIKSKEELTIEAIVNIIKEIDYDETKIMRSHNSINAAKLDINFWNVTWERLLNNFFESRTKNIIYGNKTINNGIVKFNGDYKGVEISDIKQLVFNSLYPSIIIRLINENKIKFNLEEYGIIYEFIVKNYNEMKNNFTDEDIRMKWRVIKNSLFGCSNYFKSIVNYSQNFKDGDNDNEYNMVSSYMCNFFNNIYNKYEKYIIVINTDVIYYFNDIPDSFYTDINEMNFNYEISELYDGKFNNFFGFILKDKKGNVIKNTIFNGF